MSLEYHIYCDGCMQHWKVKRPKRGLGKPHMSRKKLEKQGWYIDRARGKDWCQNCRPRSKTPGKAQP